MFLCASLVRSAWYLAWKLWGMLLGRGVGRAGALHLQSCSPGRGSNAGFLQSLGAGMCCAVVDALVGLRQARVEPTGVLQCLRP